MAYRSFSLPLFLHKLTFTATMKNIYPFLLAMLAMGSAHAQNAAISACNDPNGGIQIALDYSQNCADAPGDLSGLDSIGFHSGANQWSSVVEWNASGVVPAVALAADSFRVYIPDVQAYYGLSEDPESIYFVFNEGASAADPSNPWASEAKDADINEDGNCDDFFITLADVTETCAATASIRNQVIDLGFKVAPNPMGNQAIISFDNPTREAFQVKLMGLDGRVVREFNDVRSEQLTVERGNLTTGLYFVHFVNESGERASTRLMIE